MTTGGLREPGEHRDGNPARAQHSPATQSLARGAAGNALLAIERSLSGERSWRDAHALITAATSRPVIASTQAGLYYGAPAISFILHAAQADGTGRYHAAAERIDSHVLKLADRRLLAAEARLASRQTATFAEYDLFYGLTGIGALLLRHAPHSTALGRILNYLVQLSQPRTDGLPGWWVAHDPDPSLPTPGGHANLGMAHGASGFLSLLAIAARTGITVERHHDAVTTICSWFDRWQQDTPAGPWWPQWITRQTLANGRPESGPPRPSWCYGTPGISRAMQQAAIAIGDTARQHHAEQVLARCLADPAQIRMLTGPGLCHGTAGVYQTAWRAARDALTPAITQQLPALADLILHHDPAHDHPAGLLDGITGLSLAQRTAASPASPPASGWDTCLLITS
jgi:hypothetical protein